VHAPPTSHYTRRMRRWLAILLMVFLPLQLSWAAVAGYCGHETGAAAAHIGHHDHVGHDHVSSDALPDSEGAEPNPADFDCGHCHGCCAGMLGVASTFRSQAQASAPPVPGAAPGAEYTPAQPERPQWAARA
jgi:hypothetical protein